MNIDFKTFVAKKLYRQYEDVGSWILLSDYEKSEVYEEYGDFVYNYPEDMEFDTEEEEQEFNELEYEAWQESVDLGYVAENQDEIFVYTFHDQNSASPRYYDTGSAILEELFKYYLENCDD